MTYDFREVVGEVDGVLLVERPWKYWTRNECRDRGRQRRRTGEWRTETCMTKEKGLGRKGEEEWRWVMD